MFIPVSIDDGINRSEVEIAQITFKELNLKEDDIESFLRKNIDIIFENEESLLVIGRQVKNKENGRSDLTAIDQDGNIVLIEIKRDAEDIQHRREPFEFQAIRYAASYAKIENMDELVDKIFAPYIERYSEEFELGDLTANEKGIRIIESFLEKNDSLKTFNRKQRIILIASDFDNQTLSAIAWLISNNVNISCFALKPIKIEDKVFIDVNKILPPPQLDDYYVEIEDKKKSFSNPKNFSDVPKAYLPRMLQLFEWDILNQGNIISIRNFDGSEAEAIDYKSVKYKGKIYTFNQWGILVTGWSAVNIYEWTMLKDKGKTLDQLRRERIIIEENIGI